MTGTAPDPAPDLTELDLVRQLTRRLRRLEVHAARWGLSPHQARALGVLAREDDAAGSRVGDLAARLQVAPRSATEVADALQELGLVERRPDPADRRAVRLVLTARGREVAADLHRQRHQVAERVLAVLDDAERRQLRSLLERLLEAAADDD
ncbi:MAG TPA: MarR family transcriptional regulator [Ornithinicoccus sp.]|jgi:DNA-binding MarR family transcriptional regulator|nr:MarR family transcriptional regulator [Ornithinicoccus sp.]